MTNSMTNIVTSFCGIEYVSRWRGCLSLVCEPFKRGSELPDNTFNSQNNDPL